MDPPKRQIFVDSFTFEMPDHRRKPGTSTTPRKPTTRKPKARKKPTNRKKATPKVAPQPTPEQLEEKRQKRLAYDLKKSQTPERKEQRRRYAQTRRDEAKRLGLCVISWALRSSTVRSRNKLYRNQQPTAGQQNHVGQDDRDPDYDRQPLIKRSQGRVRKKHQIMNTLPRVLSQTRKPQLRGVHAPAEDPGCGREER